MRLEIEAEVFQEGSVMVAYARALDVSSCGKTVDDAVRALMEAVRLFVITSLEMGTFDRILAESGYILQGEDWIIPRRTEVWSTTEMVSIGVTTRRFACVEI